MKLACDMPFGAELQPQGGVRFRLWAPGMDRIALRIEEAGKARDIALSPSRDGWFETMVPEARAGTRYRYVVDGGMAVPDPASRFQPEDVHGPSEVIDPRAYDWRVADWRGRSWHETVLYELHVGTFTPEGTFRAVIDRLDGLVELGVTAVELMPLSDFPGRRNWGYDGVLHFAPDSAYGRPEDLKALVDAAHKRGLMLFVDVVYNHFGPDGNYLPVYAPQFFTDRHKTPWGAAIDFEQQRAVREFFVSNALYWLTEFNVDGLRFDAVHAIRDDSAPDILTEIATTVRERIGTGRHAHLVLENDLNEARRLRRDGQGRPLLYDAQWNDDSHHILHVMVTGETAGYYEDYAEAPARHLARVLAEGFAYQGEPSPHRDGETRGEPSGQLPPTAFVNFLQNHDQIGNRAFGDRIDRLAPPEAVDAATAIVLLGPAVPMLYMGEEWCEEHPFLFFCDFHDELADAVREGRRREFERFPEFQDPEARTRIPDPNAEQTFRDSKLDWSEQKQGRHAEKRALVKRLLEIRRAEITPRLAGAPGGKAEYKTFGDTGVLVIWILGDGSRLALASNLGPAPVTGVAGGLKGKLLFESRDGARDSFAQGTLPPWSTIVALMPGENQDGR